MSQAGSGFWARSRSRREDPNKLHHIFGQPKHNLSALVRWWGSDEAAYAPVEAGVTAALYGGRLEADGRGHFKDVFDVRGIPVTVRGRVVDGIALIGSAWISP